LVLLLILSTLLICLLQVALDGRAGEYRSTEEVLYLPHPEILRRLSFGHEGLLADLYWLRTVQYYGGKRRDVPKQNYQLLEPLLRITTALDPEMILVYRFGAVFLSEPQPVGADKPDKGLELLDEGIRRNPAAWQLLFDKGFLYFWQLKDYRRAAEWFERGSRHPGAPEWLGGLAAFAMEHGGDLESARYLWTKQYESSGNEKMRANALAHLRSLKVDQDLWTLEVLLERYREISGQPAGSWQDLIRLRLLQSEPLDPLGNPYVLTLGGITPELSPRSAIKRFGLPPEARERFVSQLRQGIQPISRNRQ
jgi:hypothetical protein